MNKIEELEKQIESLEKQTKKLEKQLRIVMNVVLPSKEAGNSLDVSKLDKIISDNNKQKKVSKNKAN